jgi:hypothetical protein
MLRPIFLRFLVLAAVAASPAIAADPPVTGKFTGNGKEAKLMFVSAQKGEPYLDKPTTVLVFTEKDHSKDKRPDFKAGFGDYGSALIITVKEDGKIIGCVVAHSAHEKKGINSLGSIAMSDFKAGDGKVAGRIKTDGVVTTFGEKWEVDIRFEAKAP